MVLAVGPQLNVVLASRPEIQIVLADDPHTVLRPGPPLAAGIIHAVVVVVVVDRVAVGNLGFGLPVDSKLEVVHEGRYIPDLKIHIPDLKSHIPDLKGHNPAH